MNIFRNTKLTWWQVEIFNWGIFGCGLLVGAYFQNWIMEYAWPIAILTVIFCLYITWVWFKQHKNFNIFRDSNFTWWQMTLFKWAVFGCGLIFGAHFQEWVMLLIWPIAFITLICCLYVTLIWFQQHKK